MKKILFVFSHSPYQSAITKDGFDALFAAASFEQTLSVLFIDEGVWTLQKNQDAKAIFRKNFEKQIQAFELYDIEDIFVDSQSLTARGIECGNLAVESVTLASNEMIQSLFSNHQHVLSF